MEKLTSARWVMYWGFSTDATIGPVGFYKARSVTSDIAAAGCRERGGSSGSDNAVCLC